MITLNFPSADRYYYLWLQNALVGPFNPANVPAVYPHQFCSSFDSIQESLGFGGDNNVDHQKFDGDLVYQHPWDGSTTTVEPHSTGGGYAEKVTITNLYMPSTMAKLVGFRVPTGLIGLSGYDVSNYYDMSLQDVVLRHHVGFRWYGDELTVRVLRSGTFATQGESFCRAFADTVYSSFRKGTDVNHVAFTKTIHTYVTGMENNRTGVNIPGWDFSSDLSCSALFAVAGGEKEIVTTSSSSCWGYECKPVRSWNLEEAQQIVDDTIIKHGNIAESGIVAKDYGDLAMEACNNARRCEVNLLEFLSDLRHPTEMIPKLKNLKNIKGLASNYLAVNYGILPTVSDLEAIEAAARKVAPFLDKNGYTVLTAGYSKTATVRSYEHTLVQRIKLAVSNEDFGLLSLCKSLESIGAFPTLSNLWDLVPYSFVLDWFVDVGDFLERVDTHLKLASMPIQYVTMSRKETALLKPKISQAFPFSGSLSKVHYHRWVSDQCPVPPLSLNSNILEFDHWVESGALIIQRK